MIFCDVVVICYGDVDVMLIVGCVCVRVWVCVYLHMCPRVSPPRSWNDIFVVYVRLVVLLRWRHFQCLSDLLTHSIVFCFSSKQVTRRVRGRRQPHLCLRPRLYQALPSPRLVCACSPRAGQPIVFTLTLTLMLLVYDMQSDL